VIIVGILAVWRLLLPAKMLAFNYAALLPVASVVLFVFDIARIES
jgi:hypothetical protein